MKIGEYWLEKDAVKDIANNVCLEHAPARLIGSIHDAIKFVKDKNISEFSKYIEEDFVIEGLVGQPLHRLKDAKCQRIQVKIKCVDFK